MDKKNICIIILVILVLAVGGFILYDKGIIVKKDVPESGIKDTEKESVKKEEEEESNSEIELDINNALVQDLYSKVSTKDTGWVNWMYEGKDSFYTNSPENNNVKMMIVGLNLNDSYRKTLDCSQSIPDMMDNYMSVCKFNELGWEDGKYEAQYAYSKEYIESIYHDIFGSDDVLDTKEPMVVSTMHTEVYYYVEQLDSYVLYVIQGGGAPGYTRPNKKVEKAVKTKNELKIFEKTEVVDHSNSNQIVDTYTFVYTFKLEENGKYRFYSRVKENKQ